MGPMSSARLSQGVSLKEVTEELVVDGVRQFADAFDKLLDAVARQRQALLEGSTPTKGLALVYPEVDRHAD